MDEFMVAAVAEARRGLAEGGIPIGAVLVLHGEMDALENAGRRRAAVYRAATMYTTLSPCAMCSGAILLYGIPRVVIGENRTFLGEEKLLRERGVVVEVLNDPAIAGMMADFIRANPALWDEDIGR
jgi:creatinine deaminase